jgi:cardiolipin synthase
VFADDWFFATGEQITEPCFYPVFKEKPKHPVSIVLGGPDIRNEPISKSLVSLLNEASDRVWIAAGYFVPDDILLTALEIAAARGVDVRLLISEKNDHPFLITVGRSYYGQLLAAGVRIFEYSEGINHSKIALADDRWAMVGSANLDYRSMRLNFELNLLFHSKEQNSALSRLFERDFMISQEINLGTFSNRPKKEKAMECILRPLSPML